jgi:hypothetical protein
VADGPGQPATREIISVREDTDAAVERGALDGGAARCHLAQRDRHRAGRGRTQVTGHPSRCCQRGYRAHIANVTPTNSSLARNKRSNCEPVGLVTGRAGCNLAETGGPLLLVEYHDNKSDDG